MVQNMYEYRNREEVKVLLVFAMPTTYADL